MAWASQSQANARKCILTHRPRDELGLWSWPGEQRNPERRSPERTRTRRVHFGHDDTFDSKKSPSSPTSSGTSDRPQTPPGTPTGFSREAIPTFTTGLTTFAYEGALQNRVLDEKLQPRGDFDVQTFTPTFIHDCLMLPGSLANLLHKINTPELISRATPALLLGFYAHVHTNTLQPCLLQSSVPSSYVQGMLMLGLGRESRDLIHAHYRTDNCRRIKVQTEIDVVVPIPNSEDRNFRAERWRLKRRTVWAHAWLWAGQVGSADVKARCQAPARGWTIEAFLSGEIEVAGAPHVVEQRRDAEAEVVELVENQPQSRETVYGASGPLEYERGVGFTGW